MLKGERARHWKMGFGKVGIAHRNQSGIAIRFNEGLGKLRFLVYLSRKLMICLVMLGARRWPGGSKSTGQALGVPALSGAERHFDKRCNSHGRRPPGYRSGTRWAG